ncbi:LOW QUALITY PROTEIN: uncharacterized protein LOC124272552 [Haliotis rubra]|uniref:LOW QUALITY PROTEIN: uncharacterized protein LOC124272552 n=1 Tax=Haliotis rubra TaxID=36100 RepID=UPI001EE52EC7|nr:LOW QUALITY PROTEIN: uncharacterized protein LOC124272552 [Haliotis rubra]
MDEYKTVANANRQSGALYQGITMAREMGLPENQIRAARVQNIPDEIKALPYFYAKFGDSKIVSNKICGATCAGPGYYLLRLSSKGDNYLSLSVSIANSSVRHVNVVIERRPALKYFIVEQVKFNSFHELCTYYHTHRICNLEQIENVKLLHPINQGADSKEDYALPSSPVNGAGVPIPLRKGSDTSLPKTPSSGQLTARFDYVEELPPIPVSSGRPRKDSNPSRPLPKTPKSSSETRPPCPPPPGYEGNSDLYYSRPRDVSKNRIDELRQILKDSEMCDCGVNLSDSELPQGWTLHKSHDAASYGCLFYQSNQGDTTWNLPLHIVPEITPKMKKIIIDLSHQSGKTPPAVLFPPYQEQMRGRTDGGQRNGVGTMFGPGGGARKRGDEG